MLQHEFLESLRRYAIRQKEQATRKRPADIPPSVVVRRGNEPIAMITVKGNLQEVLSVGSVCAGGFDADAIGMVHEGYMAMGVVDAEHPTPSINPLTGMQWSAGEMTVAVTEHGALEQGWVTECISLTAVNRAGDLGTLMLPFRYSGKHLVWLQGPAQWSTMTEGVSADGLVPDTLREMMERASVSTILPPDFGLDRDDRDILVGKFLTNQGHEAKLFAAPTDTERLAKLRRVGLVL